MSPREHISVAALYASVGLYCRSDMRARMSASSWTSRAYTRVLRMVTAVYAFGGPYWGTTRWHALIPAHEGMHAGSDACTLLSDMNSSHAFVCLRRCAFLRLRALASRRQTPSPAPRSSRSQRRRCAASVAEGPGIDAMRGGGRKWEVCMCAWVRGCGGGIGARKMDGNGGRGAGTSKTQRHVEHSTLDAFPFHHDSPSPPSLPPRQTQRPLAFPVQSDSPFPPSVPARNPATLPSFLGRLTLGPGSSRWPRCSAR
jgi:hypothetical protein